MKFDLTPEQLYKIIDHACSLIPKPTNPLMFPASWHAAKWCQGEGVELGPSVHNRMSPNAKTVFPPDPVDFAFYSLNQWKESGSYIKPDYFVEEFGFLSKFFGGCFDFICSSHVLEHIPNPIAEIIRWCILLKDRGIIYVVVPKRDAAESDKIRNLTTFDELLISFHEEWTVSTAPKDLERRGHYFVWSMELIQQVVDFVTEYARERLKYKIELVDLMETDCVVGNGHVFVLRVNK